MVRLAAGQAGDLQPFSARSEPYPNFILPLPALEAERVDVLLRVSSSSALNLPLAIVSATSSKQLLVRSWLKSGLICGALLIMALFHLAKFSTLRNRQLGYYCATLLSATVYYSAILGPINLLWPHYPALPTILLNLAGAATLIFSTLFICNLLVLREPLLLYLRNSLFVVIGLCAAPAVLVSATPSLETVANAEAGRYRRLHLPSRFGGASLPVAKAFGAMVCGTSGAAGSSETGSSIRLCDCRNLACEASAAIAVDAVAVSSDAISDWINGESTGSIAESRSSRLQS